LSSKIAATHLEKSLPPQVSTKKRKNEGKKRIKTLSLDDKKKSTIGAEEKKSAWIGA